MESCVDTEEAIRSLKHSNANFQQQVVLREKLLIAFLTFFIVYISMKNCYPCIVKLFQHIVKHVFVPIPNKSVSEVQADKPRRRSLHYRPPAFNFQTSRSSSHNDEQKVWLEAKMLECINLGDQMNKREVLVNAVQSNFGEIVDIVLWNGGSLPDQLIQAGVISEAECLYITAISTGEQNKIRTLLLLVLKRDYKTLLSFLWCLGDFNRKIREDIERSMIPSDKTLQKCPHCLLIERVSICKVADKLFSKCFISPCLILRVSKVDCFVEPNEKLWNTLLSEILDGENYLDKVTHLIVAVDQYGIHADVVELIREDLQTEKNCLKCKCGPQMELLKEPNENKDHDSGLSQVAEDLLLDQDTISEQYQNTIKIEHQHDDAIEET